MKEKSQLTLVADSVCISPYKCPCRVSSQARAHVFGRGGSELPVAQLCIPGAVNGPRKSSLWDLDALQAPAFGITAEQPDLVHHKWLWGCNPGA